MQMMYSQVGARRHRTIFERATIENALKAFAETEDYGTVIRSKGMVQSTDGTWIYFDLVDGEYELRTGEPDYTGRLVVIGTDIDEHQLEELFGYRLNMAIPYLLIGHRIIRKRKDYGRNTGIFFHGFYG